MLGNNAGGDLLRFELRRLLGQPMLLVTQLGTSASAVYLRFKNTSELEINTIVELVLYATIIGVIGLHDVIQGSHEVSFISLVQERGVYRRAALARMAVQGAVCLLLCGVGLTFSTVLSRMGAGTWSGCWAAMFGTTAFMVAGSRLIELYLSRLSVQHTGLVDAAGILLYAGGYASYLAVGVLLAATVGTSASMTAWLGAAYAGLSAVVILAVFWSVARDAPRRPAVPIPR